MKRALVVLLLLIANALVSSNGQRPAPPIARPAEWHKAYHALSIAVRRMQRKFIDAHVVCVTPMG